MANSVHLVGMPRVRMHRYYQTGCFNRDRQFESAIIIVKIFDSVLLPLRINKLTIILNLIWFQLPFVNRSLLNVILTFHFVGWFAIQPFSLMKIVSIDVLINVILLAMIKYSKKHNISFHADQRL